MGQLINIKCKKCNFDRKVKIGVGMLDFNLENIIRKFNKTIKSQIEEIQKNHTVNEYNYDSIIVECSNCKEIYSQPYLSITYDDNKDYVHGDKCMICNKNIEHIELNHINKYSCPQCHDELEAKISGYWD